MNYAIRLAYDGTRYNGWQRQGNTDRTIQGKLEAVLTELAGGPVEVQGSGRTDRGVHAEGQTANVDYNPFEGYRTTGSIRSVYLRGSLAVDKGVVLAGSHGQYIHRDRPML